MNVLRCFSCISEFSDVKIAIAHLKKEHKVKEGVVTIKCILKNSTCNKTFQTWNGLKKHLNGCNGIGIVQGVAALNIHNESSTKILWPDVPEIKCDAITIFHNTLDNENLDENHSTEETGPIRCSVESEIEDFQLRMAQHLQSFANKVEKLATTKKVKNSVFNLVKELLAETYLFNINSMKNASTPDHLEVLNVAHNAVLNEIQKFDSVYKRDKIQKANKLYVECEEMAIGTHWEMKRDKNSQKAYPNHVQSSFQYVSITKTLMSLFQRDDFKKLYFDYNNEKKHQCTEGTYRDFCCGSMFKNNNLFKDHPGSIQIQIFTDGFEVCDSLKSKTNLHNQVAFYFAIRNLPQELAFNLSNIHLVALCNSNDIKSEHTDYNNIWRAIVNDLRELECTGIEVDGAKLKGNKK